MKVYHIGRYMPKKDAKDETYDAAEAQHRFEAALRGARIARPPAHRKCDSEVGQAATEKTQEGPIKRCPPFAGI